MAHISATDRQQLHFSSLEEGIGSENPVRFIDAFVDRLELGRSGFRILELKREGRPAFDPKVFLKLYLYGYLNGIRSSRKLEAECLRNIEVHWLLGRLQPNYHSIADFRKVNALALKATFKLFVLFLKDADLRGGEVAAIDGTKFRASNSKKNNFNQKKIDRHLAYIEAETSKYLAQLEENDRSEDSIPVTDIAQKIERLNTRKIHYEALQSQLDQSGQPQISTTDADARALLVQGQLVEVSYNLQAAVDQKHKLVTASHVINRNDRNALTRIAIECKANIQASDLTVLADKGYHNGKQLQDTQQTGIKTIVSVPEVFNSNEQGTQPEYLVTRFRYDKETDTFTCPQGQTLATTGTWHKKTKENSTYLFKKYRTPACASCPVKHLCTGRAKGGREIERSEYAEAVDLNNEYYRNNPQLYRQRQELNEHIFGTIKRQWNLNYTNLRGLEKVNGEVALIMTVYNIKRALNILGMQTLLEKLKNWTPDYQKAAGSHKKRLYKRPSEASGLLNIQQAA
jgi:transposase